MSIAFLLPFLLLALAALVLMPGVAPETTPSLPPTAAPAVLLDVKAVAQLLGCSPRHVYRLADGGRMPPPLHLGALVRWRRQDLEAWLADGCKPCRKSGVANR